jgi:hypothetical protein
VNTSNFLKLLFSQLIRHERAFAVVRMADKIRKVDLSPFDAHETFALSPLNVPTVIRVFRYGYEGYTRRHRRR